MSECRVCGRLCLCAPIEPCGCGDICGPCQKAEEDASAIIQRAMAHARAVLKESLEGPQFRIVAMNPDGSVTIQVTPPGYVGHFTIPVEFKP